MGVDLICVSWYEKSDQLLRYVADRTGIIATANLILVWLFAIRNNVLMWSTGWDFATYNNFHRWVARVATVEAVVHSVTYAILICQSKLMYPLTVGTIDAKMTIGQPTWRDTWDNFVTYIVQKYFWNGVLATIFMSLISIFSIYGIRRSFYETFLFLHILLSIGVLVSMW